MSVRKRTWTTSHGEQRTAWLHAYSDSDGARHIATFPTKSAAVEHSHTTGNAIKEGRHVAPSKSATLAQAAALWIAGRRAHGREQMTLASYQSHVDLHILPLLGRDRKLTSITIGTIRAFEDEMLATGRSHDMLRRVRVSLRALLGDAMERGLVAQNVAAGLRARHASGRRARRLKAGTDYPTLEEVNSLLAAAQGKQRAFLHVAVFCGLRASELRGLRWADIDFGKNELHVAQRADAKLTIGPPKSESGQRTVPMPSNVVNVLKQWKRERPAGELVFPTNTGRVEYYANINVKLGKTLITARMTTADGKPKYTLHAFRHFFASWCLSPLSHGGRERPAKLVSTWLGHSTISMTLDTYGHLLPAGDDRSELEAATQRLLSVGATQTRQTGKKSL